jgi:fructokinase
MKKPVILSFGEVLWDLFPDGERFGGAPANFACHAAILGADVWMVSAVGDDRRGHVAMNILRDYGIDVRLLQIIPGAPTGTVGVALDGEGKPTFTIHEGSAWDRLAWNQELEARVTAADAVYFGTLGQRDEASRDTIRRCVKRARAVGVPRVVDVNLRPPFFDEASVRASIELASILKLSDDEISVVSAACGIHPGGPPEPLLRQLLETQDLDLVVLTCGAQGAVLATPAGVIHQPGIAVTVRDTVGAGDAFTASFLLGLLRGEPHAENLRNACAVAAAVCSHSGAVPNHPSTSPSLR